jgi:acetyl-CoA acetyltransferase
MRDVYIAGVAMTPFAKYPDRSLRSLAAHAVAGALADAGGQASDVESAFFANAADGLLSGQESIRGQVALQDTGLLGIPIVNVENACASASTAFHLAATVVGSGCNEVSLAVGAEKLHTGDRARTFAAFDGAIDVERRPELEERIYGAGGGAGDGTLFMDIYADLAHQYMERSGATERDFAHVAAKNRSHGAANPNAQYRHAVSVDDVLASRTVSGVLRLLMCSPIGDGAAALVLCSEEYVERIRAEAVRVRATALVSGDATGSAPARAAQKAYERAGVGPEDLDVVEVHDAAAPAELICCEELGLCAPGEGPALLASGATSLGGRIPVNPSGGLIARGHPVGATGAAQLVELTQQLLGRAGARQVDGARVALAENAGGFLGSEPAAAAVTILSRD